jgi:hypothetical protein
MNDMLARYHSAFPEPVRRMNDKVGHAPSLAEIDAARMLLEKLATRLMISAAPPTAASPPRDCPGVSDAVSLGTRRACGSYWNRVIQAWGPRLITDVDA